MSIPHLSTLQNISQLQDKIKQLAQKVQSLESKLAEKKAYYERSEKSYFEKTLQKLSQQILLEKIQLEVSELRSKEKVLKAKLDKKISEITQKYFHQNGFSELVELIVNFNKEHELVIEASSDMKSKLKQNFTEIPGQGLLRINANCKSYILDEDVLTEKLSHKLLIKSLTK